MIARAKTFGSPSGQPSTTRPYDSTNVRKTLDTTVCLRFYGYVGSFVFSWRFADTGESGGTDCKLSSFGFHLLSAHLYNSF
jgi:hypothetical protein